MMTITFTTSVAVDIDAIKTALFEDCLGNVCFNCIPEFSMLSDEQQEEVKNRVWDKIVK